MKLPFYKQFIIIALIFGITFNADLSRFAQAADEPVDTTGVAAENEDTNSEEARNAQPSFPEFDEIDYTDDAPEFTDYEEDQESLPETITAFQTLADVTKEITAESDEIFNLSTALGLENNGVSRIIMPTSDLEKIKNIYYMAKVLPDYENDHTSLYRDLPAPTKEEVDKALSAESNKTTPLFNSPETYFSYLKDGGDSVDASDMVKNIEIYNKLVLSAEQRLDSEKIRQIWKQLATDIAAGNEITADTTIIARITDLKTTDIDSRLQNGTPEERGVISKKINDFLEKSLVDIRIVKTLVYLVTPKSQGGAGHWKITVSRIFQKSELSSESQPEKTVLASDTTDTSKECPEDMTAADCGYLQTSRATAEVEDADGQKYEAYIQDLTEKEDQFFSSSATVDEEDTTKKPTSVHASGQAVDISEIDDIRCTLVQKKRIGADKVSAQPIQPIKLAWQTSEGYDASGGNSGADVMDMMKTVASDTMKEFLSTFNGDMAGYEGDLSRASFEDILKILGESMVGYAISGSGQVTLKGYSTKETLKNLGGMYLADYMGLPREIFMGDNALLNGKNDIEDTKYLIGRTAIEQRLGLAYGSLDNTIVINGTEQHNLEGLLTNLGRRKLETEMNLEQGALKDINTRVSIEFGVGKNIIEQEFNLKKGTWPDQGSSFYQLKDMLPMLRVQTMKQDPGYVDSLFRIPHGTTQALIDGRITEDGVVKNFNAYEYAFKVGKIRMDDTVTGLKYFAAYNDAYQLPEGTWEKAVGASSEAFKTIGIYTLARLLGDDTQVPDTKGKLPEGKTIESVTWDEQGVPYTYSAQQNFGNDDFGRLAFRNWLRENLNPAKTKDDACKTKHKGLNINVAADNNAGRTLSESIDIVRTQLCPMDVIVPYSLNYKEGIATQSVATEMVVDIPETKAKAVGLDSLDMYRIMGYSSTDGRSVFSRIGSKILYYALTNKALSGDDRIKIDLKDVNPVVTTDNKEINFYIDHVFTAIDLASKIETDWNIIKKDSSEARAIADKIDEIIARLGTTFSDTESDASKFQKIAAIAKDISSLVSDLTIQVTELKAYYKTLTGPDAQQKVQQINAMIIHLNALNKCVSEMIAGKEIKQIDDLQLNEIELSISSNTNLTDNSSDRRTNKKISAWKMASFIFSFLSGKASATDTFISIGSGVAEANLGLPANSLYYLIQNYEERGLQTVDGFYEAIGQARIEEQFNMPAFYFQGFSLDTKMPKFSLNNSQLKQWLPNSVTTYGTTRDYTGIKKMSNEEFDKFLTNLLFPNLKFTDGGVNIGKTPARSAQMTGISYSVMIWDAETNWQKVRTQELEKNGRLTIGEKTLNDVTRNINERGYGDGLRKAEDDLLFKMGFPTGIYDSLTTGGSSDWSEYSSTASNIDDLFEIPTGSTQSLFTGEAGLYSTSVTNKEKNLVESSSLNIGINFLEKYIQLINGEILPSEMEMYAHGQTADYITNNPYAKAPEAADTCPVIYTASGDFQVNNSEKYLENDSFCYYDQKGRHCFQSSEEAQRYANENDIDALSHMRLEDTNGDGKIDNSDDEIGNDILGYIAMKLTIAYNYRLLGTSVDAFGRPTIDDAGNSLVETNNLRISYVDFYNGLVNFVNNKTVDSIFDEIKVNGTSMSSGIAIGMLADQTDLSTDLLTRLFMRTSLDAPVANFKRLVGREESQKIITGKIFDLAKNSELGVGPFEAAMFDGGDLYDLLHGDFSSVYRVGAKLVDDQMEFKPGTTALIAAASSLSALNCAMAQAGGQYLGKLFGLSSLPLNGISGTKDFIVTIGSTKIEESLSLPVGSFRGNTISEVIKNIGAINFAVGFKIPQKDSITYEDIFPILGANKASSVSNSSDLEKLKAVQRFLSMSPVISNVAYAGVRTLEAKIKNNVDYVINKFASANPADLQNSIGSNPTKNEVSWHNEVAAFVYLLWNLDARFDIDAGSTFKLFSKQFTTDQYVRLVADKAVQRAGAVGLGSALGLDSYQSTAAANLIINFEVIFLCKSSADDTQGKGHELKNGVCNQRNVEEQLIGTTVSRPPEPLYHNWSYLYQNLDKVFNFKLDERANVPQGTFAQLIREPENATKIIMKIGTTKLDQKYDLDSNTITSFSGLFKYLFPSETGIAAGVIKDDQSADLLLNQGYLNLDEAISKKKIELATYQSPYNIRFGDLIPIVESLSIDKARKTELLVGIENILMSEDTDENKTYAFGALLSAYLSDSNIAAKLSDIFESLVPVGTNVSRCLRELTILETQRSDIENQIAKRHEEKSQNIVLVRAEKANQIDKDNGGIPGIIARTGDRVWAWAKDAAAEQIHNKILQVEWNGQQIGIDMPITDVKMMFKDVRYVAVAGMAMSANLVQIQIDRVGSANCNSTELVDGKCPTAVPSNFRLTYADFHSAFFGIPSLEAEKLSAYIYVTGNTPNPATTQYNFSNAACVNTGSGNFSAGIDCLDKVEPGYQNTTVSLTTNMEKNYDYTPANYANEIAKQQGIISSAQAGAEVYCSATYAKDAPGYQNCFDEYVNANPAYQSAKENVDILENTKDHASDLKNTKKNLLVQSKTNAWENLQFKLMDIGLWKLDDNVFPGFGRAIMRGNTETKIAALVKYTENGLGHGHLFGIKFEGLSEGGILIAKFAAQFFNNKFIKKDPNALKNSFVDFASGAGLNYMTDWVVKNSKDWFGFKLPGEVFKGILVGLCTGQWGFTSISVSDVTGGSAATTEVAPGIKLPTLGSALIAFATNWIFNWADKQFKWKLGTAFSIFIKGWELYQNIKSMYELKNYTSMTVVASLSSNTQKLLADAEKLREAGETTKSAEELAEIAAATAILKIVMYFVSPAVARTVHAKWDEDFRSFENENGLVPGSLNILIDAVVDVFVALIIQLVVYALVSLAVLGPVAAAAFTAAAAALVSAMLWFLAVAFVLFIITNLFGVYEVDYYCTADGYFPYIDSTRSIHNSGLFGLNRVYNQTSPPSYITQDNDISGLGVWGGKVSGNEKGIQALMKTKSVEAAQYKARRLIGDLLNLQNYTKYNDSSNEPTVPIQIMTGRQVDVDYWESNISKQMCAARLGEGYVSRNGVCSKVNAIGEVTDTTRMGVWKNLQNVAFTHIGF